MRILFAPHEIAGQIQPLAEAFRRKGHPSTAVSYETQEQLRYINDVNLNLKQEKLRIKKALKILAFTLLAILNNDVFHFFYGQSLLPRGGRPTLAEVARQEGTRPLSGSGYQEHHLEEIW